MSQEQIFNTHIRSETILTTPRVLKERLPNIFDREIFNYRELSHNIITHKDPRMLVVVGPCSIHDEKAAIEYAQRLSELSKKVEESLLVVMRVYFEKPRTVFGWKGLISDPYLDDSFKIEDGLELARSIMLKITGLGLPIAIEALDPMLPQYLGDLVTWTAIGARTTESQTHREMASGISTPVGFKNGTDGNLEIAINGILSASKSHRFLGVTQDGVAAVFETTGNKSCHMVMRGGIKPNYDADAVAFCKEAHKKVGLKPSIMIDCSHANSNKDHKNQGAVFKNIIEQRCNGNSEIIGAMLESNLFPGKQNFGPDFQYGISVTDACIGWEETEELLLNAAKKLKL